MQAALHRKTYGHRSEPTGSGRNREVHRRLIQVAAKTRSTV